MIEGTLAAQTEVEDNQQSRYVSELLLATKELAGSMIPQLSGKVEVKQRSYFGTDFGICNNIHVWEIGPENAGGIAGLFGRKSRKLLFDVDAAVYYHKGPDSRVMYVDSFRPELDQQIRTGLEKFCTQNNITDLVLRNR